jgi:hypothetical protein
MIGLQPSIENLGPTPSLPERYYENMQDDVVISKTLGLVSMEKDDEEEEMSEEDVPDNDSGFQVDRSRHHWCRH